MKCPVCECERVTKHVKVFSSTGVRVTRYRCAFCGTKFSEAGEWWHQPPLPMYLIDTEQMPVVKVPFLGEIS